MLLEVCIDSHAGLARALAGGAGRLEVCARLDQGGLTPSDELLAAALASGVPCVAMARPRGGSHVWPAAEHAVLLADVERARVAGVAGVVLGAITPDGGVDQELCARLVAAARPLPVVFHRAFDQVRDRSVALETLVELGCARVLTSGGAPNAFEGRFELAELVERAAGRIGILPGGGVRAHNAAVIRAVTGVAELHSSTPFLAPRTAGPTGLVVRPEAAPDHDPVEALVRSAFGGDLEPRLVARLRGLPGVVSLVAELDGALVGHVLFSPVRARGRSTPRRAMGLAPLAVASHARRNGVGARLVEAGLAILRRSRVALVVVLGEADYYARFGFSSAARLGLACRWGGADGEFQALELASGAAFEFRGSLDYDPAFDADTGPSPA